MDELLSGIKSAFKLLLTADSQLIEIILLSLKVTLSATLLAAIIAMPIGVLLAISKIRGKSIVLLLVNSLMGLPPVLVGLLVYLLLSHSGPLGILDLLYTPTAMIIAQTIIIAPFIVGLSHRVIADKWPELAELFLSIGAKRHHIMVTLIWDNRISLLTAIVSGFGRAIGEVGAIMIVGGNIAHLTRVMTTAITLETRRGNIDLAVGLGIILMLISLVVNIVLYRLSILGNKASVNVNS